MNYCFNPYTSGRPVEGQDFYGRGALLNKIRSQRTSVVHLVGMRRIGKTSILKKLVTMEKAIFVDLQAVSDWADFAVVLQDEIEMKQGQLPWLPVTELLKQSPDLFSLLRQLDSYFHQARDRLWLLLDETEVLIGLGQGNISALRKFQSFLRHMKALRIVFASAKGLVELHELTSLPEYGSPFLSEFPPPIYISGLDDEAAKMLIQQSQSSLQLPVSNGLMETICRRTNNHPYFIQWICYHLYEKTPDVAAWQIDDQIFMPTPGLQCILKVDFDYLSEPERQAIQVVLTQQSTLGILQPYLDGLTSLGYLRGTNTGYKIGNDFLKNWLLGLENQAWTKPSEISAEDTLNFFYEKTEKQGEEETMSDPYSVTWALMVLEKATEFLFNQAGELLKERREKRKKTAETSASPSSETDARPISDSETLMTTLEEQLSQLEKRVVLAISRMEIQKVDSLMKQLEDYSRNKLMYEEERARLPGLDDRIAIQRRIEDIDNLIVQKADEMRQHLEQLSQRKIHIPALDE